MQEYRITADQVTLQVREFVHPSEAIIFLHFGGANLMMWQRAIPYFSDRYRLVTLDLRGHGRSEAPQGSYHMDVMAGDVLGVMQSLKIEQAHVVGSSLGAEVGLSMAANHPGVVRSLVCDGALSSEYGPYGTWEGSEAEFDQYVSRFLEKLHNSPEKTYPSADALVEASRAGLLEAGWWNEYVEAMLRYGTCPLEEGLVTSSFRKFAREDYFSHYFSYRFEDYYQKVSCPVLMVAGETVFDQPRERAAMQGLASLAAQAKVVKVDGWQHPYGWLIDPASMCRVVLDFLSGI